jgi:hypothetical protein
MPTDREIIDALCLVEIGWSTEHEGRAFREACALLREHGRSIRTKQQEDAILAEADAIRARRDQQ